MSGSFKIDRRPSFDETTKKHRRGRRPLRCFFVPTTRVEPRGGEAAGQGLAIVNERLRLPSGKPTVQSPTGGNQWSPENGRFRGFFLSKNQIGGIWQANFYVLQSRAGMKQANDPINKVYQIFEAATLTSQMTKSNSEKKTLSDTLQYSRVERCQYLICFWHIFDIHERAHVV